MSLGRIVCVRHRTVACAILGSPLVRTSRTLGEFPLVPEQVLEVVIAPFRRRGGPNDFQAAADRITAFAGAKFALPAQALLFHIGSLRFGADILGGNRGAVGLTEAVTARDQRDGFFIVHGHTTEGFANVHGRSDRIRLSIGSFGVYVNQAHLHRSERIGQITITAVALVRQPLAFGTPVDIVFGLPDILASAAKTERLEPHRLESNVACENHEVGPGNLPAILLLDRPQQPARLVEVYVVGPAIERRKALLSGSGAAAAVADAVRTSAMPRHADEQRSIVAEVSRP